MTARASSCAWKPLDRRAWSWAGFRVRRSKRPCGASATWLTKSAIGVPLLVIQGVTKLAISPMESRACEVLITAALRRAESESHGAQAAELVPLQSFAHMALSTACIVQGKYHEAAFHARRAIETYNPAYQSPSSDSRVHALAEYAVAQWTLGYADEARRLMLEAIAAGEKTGNANAL